MYECLELILCVFPSDLVCDLSLFWEMLLVVVRNTLAFLFPVSISYIRYLVTIVSCFLLGIL